MEGDMQPEYEGEAISCAKCGAAPEDVLILTCDHNLCISCAAANLRREQQKSRHTFQVLFLKFKAYRLSFVISVAVLRS